MFAVLLDAISQLRQRQSTRALEAQEWIRDVADEGVFSYANVCGVLGFEPRSLRLDSSRRTRRSVGGHRCGIRERHGCGSRRAGVVSVSPPSPRRLSAVMPDGRDASAQSSAFANHGSRAWRVAIAHMQGGEVPIEDLDLSAVSTPGVAVTDEVDLSAEESFPRAIRRRGRARTRERSDSRRPSATSAAPRCRSGARSRRSRRRIAAPRWYMPCSLPDDGDDDVVAETIEEGQRMNWDQIEGKWKQLKGRVRETWEVSPTTTSTRSAASASASRVSCRKNTASRRTKRSGRSPEFERALDA